MVRVFRLTVLAFAMASFVCTATVAQNGIIDDESADRSRPWLEGLPIANQSVELDLPAPPEFPDPCQPIDPLEVRSDGPFSDERYLRWTSLVATCEWEILLAELEAELLAGSPHSEASLMWAQSRLASGRLEAGWEVGVAPELLDALGPVPELVRLYHSGNDAAAYFYLSGLPEDQRLHSVSTLQYWQWIDLQALGGDTQASKLEMIRRHPDRFDGFWPGGWDDRDLNDQVRDLFAPGGELDGHFFADAFLYYHFETDRDRSDRREYVLKWLEQHPNDPSALNALATVEREEGYPDKAVKALDLRYRAKPHSPNSRMIDQSLLVEDRATAAWAAARLAKSHGQKPGDQEAYFLRGLRRMGAVNEARQFGLALLAIYPGNLTVLRQFRDLEQTSKNELEWLDMAQRTWRHPHASWNDAANLMDALTANGMGQKAINLYREALARLRIADDDMIIAAADAAKAMEIPRFEESVLIQGSEAPGNRDRILRRLGEHYAERGKYGSAVETWKKLLTEFRGFRNDYRSLFRAARNQGEMPGFSAAMDWTKRNAANHQQAAYASILEAREVGERDLAISLIEDARKTWSDQFWPLYLELDFVDAGNEPEVAEALNTIRQMLPKLSGGDAEWAMRNFSSLAVRAVSRKAAAEEVLDEARALFDRYSDQTSTGMALNSGRRLFKALKDDARVMELLDRHLRARPTDNDAILDVIETRLAEGHEERFMAIWRSLALNREHNLGPAVRAHALWGGSKILPVCLAQWLRREYPEGYPAVQRWERRALKNAGDIRAAYRANYDNTTAIGASKSTIQAFHDERRSAQQPQRVFDFDCERGVLTTVSPDGELRVTQSDYRTGKLLLNAIGRKWIRYRYGDHGVEEMASSIGDRIALVYNTAGKIVSMIRIEDGKKEAELGFEYNDLGKPSRVIDDGYGYIVVDYDSDGAITAVTPYDEQGKIADPALSLRITQSFQRLLSLTRPSSFEAEIEKISQELASRVSKRFSNGVAELEAMAVSDPRLIEKLTELYELAMTEGYSEEQVLNPLDQASSNLLSSNISAIETKQLLEYGNAILAFYRSNSPFGLTPSRWTRWQQFLAEAERRAGRRSVRSFLADLADNPLAPMNSDNWSGSDRLRVSAFWDKTLASQVIPIGERSGLEFADAFIRENGEALVASNRGLLIHRQGSWQRHNYLRKRGGWIRDEAGEFAGDGPLVSSIAEMPNGTLAVGTNEGIFFVGEDFENPIGRLASGPTGLPSRLVHDLAVIDGRLWVGTEKGAAVVTYSNSDPVVTAISGLTRKASIVAGGPDGKVIIGTDAGILTIDQGKITRLSDQVAEGIGWSQNDNRLLILEDEKIHASYYVDGRFLAPVLHPTSRAARLLERGFGMSELKIGDSTYPVVMGDRGLAIWSRGYFEYLPVPLSSELASVQAMSTAGDRIVLATGQGNILTFDPQELAIDPSLSAVSLAYDRALDRTYYTKNNRIGVILSTPPGQEPEHRVLARLPASHIDVGNDNHVIAVIGTSGGAEVWRVSPDGQEELLFEPRITCPSGRSCSDGVGGVLAARDGRIWVTVGPSLFVWQAGEVKEYSMFTDAEGTLRNSEMLLGVFETSVGDIVVGAANRHGTDYYGNRIQGTNLVLRGDRLVAYRTAGNLVTSLTRTSDVDILGTTGGFFEAKSPGAPVPIASTRNKSFRDLLSEHPNLYISGEGATLGDDTWVFPTPAGLIAYQSGTWFYPERINWQYPSPELVDLGSRHTYAVTVDTAGRIYASTDHGLLTFQKAGGDALAFLIDNGRPDLTFSVLERRKLRQEANVLLSGVENETSGKLATAKRALTLAEEIKSIRTGKTRATALGGGNTDASAAYDPSAEALAAELEDPLIRKEREYRRLLAILEREEPGLAQLVKIEPLELSALQRRIPEDAAIVQYIPQETQLLIHVIGRDRSQIYTIDVPREAMMDAAQRSNLFLTSSVARVEQQVLAQAFARPDAADQEVPIDNIYGDLRTLYEVLLAPIEADLEQYQRIYISAAGGLNYVPFGALIRARAGERQFAVERFTMAMIPTSSFLQLALADNARPSTDALIFGNPDGTLVHAEIEASRVGDLLRPDHDDVHVRLRQDATLLEISQHSGNSRILHFATHGKLDAQFPEESYLVLADRERLKFLDIMKLNLDNTQLAFLSACETGLGTKGIEHSTLARSFAIAGVPTTIASLWKVGDAGTLQLVSKFYEDYTFDSMAALADAQRALISTGGPYSHPSVWSAFQVYGRGWSDY